MDASDHFHSRCFLANRVVGYLRRIIVLNNLAEQLANVGDYVPSIATCRVALLGLKMTSTFDCCKDVQDNSASLDLYIAQMNQKLFRSKSLVCNRNRMVQNIYVSISGMNISDCFLRLAECNDQKLCTVTLDVLTDSELSNESNIVDTLCSIIMYNLGIFHLLATKCEASLTQNHESLRSTRLQASRQILTLALNVMELQYAELQQGDEECPNTTNVNCNTDEIFQQVLLLSMLCLMTNGISSVSSELGDDDAVAVVSTLHTKLKGDLHQRIRWTSKVYGALTRNRTAPAA